MDKFKLTIHIGAEATDEEIKAVEEAFSEGFEVTVVKGIIRLSDDQLPFLAHIAFEFFLNVSASVFLDYLKGGVQELMKLIPKRSGRDVIVKMSSIEKSTHRENGKETIITKDECIIQGPADEPEVFDSIDRLFQHYFEQAGKK